MFYIALFAICFLITIWVCDYLFSLNWSSLTVCTAHGVGTRCQISPELWNIEYLLKLLVLSILMSTSLVRISPTSTPYSHDLKTGHSKSGSIWKPDILKVEMSNGWPFENQTKPSSFPMVNHFMVRFSNAIWKPDKTTIPKPDHFISDLLSTIQKLDTSGFRIPTVFE